MSKILILAEHDNGTLKQATLAAAGFAAKAGAPFEVLVLGANVGAAASALATCGAVAKSRGATLVVGVASTFTKDVLPRAAALLDAGMLSDVIDVRAEGGDYVFRRVQFAGNVIATVQLGGAVRCLTVRGAAFPAPAPAAAAAPIENIAVDASALPNGI
jgi:electron transfer flavoprotein alpha subunit